MRKTVRVLNVFDKIYLFKIFLFLCNFLVSAIISKRLTGSLEIGGAIFIAFRIFIVYIQLFLKKKAYVLPSKTKKMGYYILLLAVLSAIFQLLIYPIAFNVSNISLLISFLFLMFLWNIFMYTKLAENKKAVISFYILVFLSIAFICCFIDDSSTIIIIFVGTILSIILNIYIFKNDLFLVKKYSIEDLKKARELLHINSYYQLYKITISVFTALFIILIVTVFYLVNSTEVNLSGPIYVIMIIAAIIGVITTIVKRILEKINIIDIDANTLILIGAFMLIFSTATLYRISGSGISLIFYILAFQGGLGISIILSAIIHISSKIEKLIYFEKGEIQNEILKLNHRIVLEWSFLIGLVVILILVTSVNYLNQYNLQIDFSWKKNKLLEISFFIIPSVFMLLAIVNTLRQPYTKEYSQKLNRYFILKAAGEDRKILKNKLKKVLVGKYTRKYGIKIVAAILKPFCYHKVINKSIVRSHTGPKVFVSNHGNIYGPIVTNLYIPFFFRPWVISYLFDKKEFYDYVYNATIKHKKWIPEFLKKPICKLLGIIVPWAMKSLFAIPVYRGNYKMIMKTFNLSVNALMEEDNILIFPENPEVTDGYEKEDVGDFYSGFSHLAIKYYRKTNKRLEFYPIYASKKKKKIIFGEPVRYDPNKNNAAERKRISKELSSKMRELKNRIEN